MKGSVRRLKKLQERWGSMGLFKLQHILEVKEMQESAFEQPTSSEGSLMLQGDQDSLNSTNSEDKWYGQSPRLRKEEV